MILSSVRKCNQPSLLPYFLIGYLTSSTALRAGISISFTVLSIIYLLILMLSVEYILSSFAATQQRTPVVMSLLALNMQRVIPSIKSFGNRRQNPFSIVAS